jgi:hypothetical protein
MLELPDDYVPTPEQAHAAGLLTMWDAAKLLDMGVVDLAQEVGAGRIEITARFNNMPCFSLRAVDDYRLGRNARAS